MVRTRRLHPVAILLAGAAGAASATCPRAAWGEGPHAVVFVAEGADGDALASRLASRLPAGYAPTDAHAFRASLAGRTARPLTGALKSRRADGELVTRAKAAASGAHVEVAVLLQVRKSKKTKIVHVWVVDARPGDAVLVEQDVPWPASASLAAEAETTWEAIASAFPGDDAPAAAAPPAATAPAPSSASASASAPESASAPAPPADTASRGSDVAGADAAPQRADAMTTPALAHLGVAVEGGSRHFAYTDRLTATLRPYDLFMAPVVAVRADLEPLAHSGQALLEGLGLAGEYARAFGLSSADASGGRVSTTWQCFHVDLRDRVRIGETAYAGAHAGFGGNDFKFDGALGGPAELPSVAYRFVRAGLEGQGALGGFRIYGSASYLFVLSTGAVGDLFPREGVGGIDASLGIARALARDLDLSVEVAYARFFYSMRPEPGDPYVAGGALDEMASISLGATYAF